MKQRLDQELVKRGLAPSREQAQHLIEQGIVVVQGLRATKAATRVDNSVSIALKSDVDDFASRGAYKLMGALDAFDFDVTGLRVLDAGASTGGFTDVLLRRGAREVVAVDVGYGQLIWSLRQDPRVRTFDRTNVRYLTAETIDGKVDLTVADLSFISLTVVMPALCSVTSSAMLLMVKPQFEVGRENLGNGGVVKDPALRQSAIEAVISAAEREGWQAKGVVASPLPGPAGNVEYFLWLVPGQGHLLEGEIATAIAQGPQ